MKNQDLFSSKDKSKKLKCRLLQFLFGALRVKAGTTRSAGQHLHTELLGLLCLFICCSLSANKRILGFVYFLKKG